MPPPTRQFHRLSIGQMPARDSTRSARAGWADPSDERAREGEGSSPEESSEEDEESEESSEEEDDEEEEEEDEGEGSASAGPSTIVSPHSGITYDLSNLDTESEAEALVGLGQQFDVVNSRATSTGYDVELLDRPRVHLGQEATTCTCLSFQKRPGAPCQHIFVSSFPGRKQSEQPRESKTLLVRLEESNSRADIARI